MMIGGKHISRKPHVYDLRCVIDLEYMYIYIYIYAAIVPGNDGKNRGLVQAVRKTNYSCWLMIGWGIKTSLYIWGMMRIQ